MGHYATLARQYGDNVKPLRDLIPDAWKGFSALHGGSTGDGALSKKTKEMIAVAIGVSVHCEACIALHTQAAIRAGATREEFAEMISVALLMGGGPASVYGGMAMAAYDEFAAA